MSGIFALRASAVLRPAPEAPAAPPQLRPGVVVVDGAHIAAICEAPPAGVPLLELGDLALLPGVVDAHVHVNEPGRESWEGWATATAAAALGGVTTLIDMPLNAIPVTTSRAALDAKIASTAGKLAVDVGFWGGVVPGNIAELGPMVAGGARGFKCFLCPSGIDEFPAVGAPELRAAMPALRALGVPLLVHAELEGPLDPAAPRPADFARDDYAAYLHSRPPEFEDRAVAMIAELVAETGCPAHIVHLSSAGALDVVRRAKAAGLPLTAETCPHYLCLSAEDVPRGATAFKCAPPIRPRANQAALWAALLDGTLDFVVTDHSPCVAGLKRPDTGDFLDAWGGISSLQLGLASLATAAQQRGVPLSTLSGWLTEGPARLAGLPGRGLRPGARADLVAFDMNAPWVVDPAKLAHKNPISAWAGRALSGQARHTFLRGQHIVQDGVLNAKLTGQPLTQPRHPSAP